VAAHLMITEAMVAERQEDKGATAMPTGGGMDGMGF
jgi:hypothetical protein